MTTLQRVAHSISANDLATWIEQLGIERWWTVDGDPLLSGRMILPCPGDELAEEIRKVNLPLVVFEDTNEAPLATPIDATNLSQLAHPAWQVGSFAEKFAAGEAWARMLVLAWQRSPDKEWLLVEDADSTEWAAGLVAENEGV